MENNIYVLKSFKELINPYPIIHSFLFDNDFESTDPTVFDKALIAVQESLFKLENELFKMVQLNDHSLKDLYLDSLKIQIDKLEIELEPQKLRNLVSIAAIWLPTEEEPGDDAPYYIIVEKHYNELLRIYSQYRKYTTKHSSTENKGFNWFEREKNGQQIPKLFNNLKKQLSPDTKLINFRKIFSNEDVTMKIDWKADPKELIFLFILLHSKHFNLLTDSSEFSWIKLSNSFTIEGQSLNINSLKTTKTLLMKEIKDLPNGEINSAYLRSLTDYRKKIYLSVNNIIN